MARVDMPAVYMRGLGESMSVRLRSAIDVGLHQINVVVGVCQRGLPSLYGRSERGRIPPGPTSGNFSRPAIVLLAEPAFSRSAMR